MKSQLHKFAFATTLALAGFVNQIDMVAADPLPTTIRTNPNIQLQLNPTTISGEVAIVFGHYASQGSLQCKDLSVALNSVETAAPKPGDIQVQGAPIFSSSRKLSGNLNTGKCNYSVSTQTANIGKKATVTFFGGGDGGSNSTPVTIPSQPLKANMQATFTKIG
jgi:hypothetical protein